MTSRKTRAFAALLVGPALAAWAIAGSLPADFDGAQAAIRADLGTERLWPALERADELAARDGLNPAQQAWALHEAARLRTRVGDEAGAERNLRDALRTSPGDPEISRALARLLSRTAPEAALRVADEAGADVLAGELRLELGDMNGARASLAKALATGDDLEALAAMARAQGDKAAAAGFAARARRAADREPRWSRGAAKRFCGRLWLELGDEVRAAEAFESALADDPDDLDALRALSRLQSERPASALMLGNAASSIPPEGVPAASLAAADLFLETIPEAPAWRQPEAYAAIAQSLLKLGPAAKERAYAAASRALALDGPPVRVALLLMRSVATPQLLDEPGSVEFAGSAFRAVVAERLRLGDREGARKTVERGLRLLPESVQLRLDLARLSLEDGRPAQALKELARLPPGGTPAARLSRAEGHELRAKAEHALKDDAAAEKSLQAAVAEAPVEREELARVAVVESEIGLSTAAYAHLDRLMALSESPYERAEAYSRRAEAQRAFKDGAGAAASLERALTLVPDDRERLARLVDLETAFENPKALEDAERLVRAAAAAGGSELASAEELRTRVRRAFADSDKRAARAHASGGDRKGAEAGLERTLALNPNDTEALSELVGLSLADGRREAARTYAERLVAASRGVGALTDAYERLAQTQQEIGDEAGARAALARARALEPELREALKSALAETPGDWPARKRLAELELGGGDAREALALFEGSPAANGLEAPWLVWRGSARAAAGDEAGAGKDFAAAAKRDAHGACLGSELPARRETLALAYFDACVARLPDEPRLYVDRGLARYQSGRAGAAIEDFRRAVSLKPGSPEAQLSLVSALQSAGRADEARAAADCALDILDARSEPLYGRLVELRRRLEKKTPAE